MTNRISVFACLVFIAYQINNNLKFMPAKLRVQGVGQPHPVQLRISVTTMEGILVISPQTLSV